ncbi:S41 family peptidase [Foetidibacter luteolus]|uniref:S41 family peptidase n=1 Tax=Foetidibacter luteolus TaxID=2608880 RepID=UPI00129A5AB0|nr:S41 family peptidase [Foetidibacter luteolus]
MMNYRRIGFVLLIGWVFFTACGTGKYAQQTIAGRPARYAPEQLKDDIRLLKTILEANHPSLYWYTPKDTLDNYFATAINSITDSLTEFQFRNRVAWVISKIRCGHTSVRFSKAYSKRLRNVRAAQFPLLLKTWGDSIIVMGSAFKNDSIFKRGTVITSINGYGNRQLLDSMFQFISTDGYSDNFKSQLCSFNFAGYYYNAYGPSEKYLVGYIDAAGAEQTALIKQYKPPVRDSTAKQDSLAKKEVPAQPVKRQEKPSPSILAKRSLTIDTANSTAYMRLATFSNARLRRFFRRSFKTLRQQNIQNLVIDLRENGGGNIGNSINLQKYLSATPFRVADTVAAPSRNLKYKKYLHPAWIYWFAMHFTGRRDDDGRIHYRWYERHLFSPKEKNHFNGQVYLVQGGYTFSAATMLVSGLKGQPNVTVVGEETGGGSYGNSAVYLPEITLPNSRIRVTMPVYRVVINEKAIGTKGRGILPDVSTPPSSLAIRQNIDPKMQMVLRMIKEKNKTHLAGKE